MALTRRISYTQPNRMESILRDVDERTTNMTGISLFYILTGASIAAAISLFASGRKNEGIFVGLWAPVLLALKSFADRA